MKTLLFPFLVLALAARAEIDHAQGEFAGEPTASSVLLQSRLTAIPGFVLDMRGHAEGDIPGTAGVAW